MADEFDRSTAWRSGPPLPVLAGAVLRGGGRQVKSRPKCSINIDPRAPQSPAPRPPPPFTERPRSPRQIAAPRPSSGRKCDTSDPAYRRRPPSDKDAAPLLSRRPRSRPPPARHEHRSSRAPLVSSTARPKRQPPASPRGGATRPRRPPANAGNDAAGDCAEADELDREAERSGPSLARLAGVGPTRGGQELGRKVQVPRPVS